MLVSAKEMLEKAKAGHYAVGQFNINNLEWTKSILLTAEELKSPVILGVSEGAGKYMTGYKTVVGMVNGMMEELGITVPVALHLDHGSYEGAKKCIEAGFSSIMFDGSHLPFEENIEEVKRAVEYCHFYNVPVEAELGCLQGKEEDIVNEADAKTDPDMVADFVSQTGCDLLAVAVGNVHGLDIEPKVDLPLLEQISKISPVPLVMHGGSGIPFDIIQKAREFNLLKVNYGSDLRKAFVSTFGQAYEANHNACSVIELSIEAVENVSEKAAELVTIINS